MTLNEIIKIVGGISNIDSNEVINNIKTDTRIIEKNDIFIALKGSKYDGNDYIEEAIKKGALACISTINKNDKCIVVNNTYDSLYLISKYIRNKYDIPLIGITGSNGKTTTKDLLYYILSSKYKVLKNEESKNNIIGISNTLFNLDNTYDLIVIELGTNHIGEINLLSNMINPDTSIITNIGSSHLEYFKNKKNIFKEKYSIINGMRSNNLIINGDDKYLKKLNYYKCGINKNNNLIAYDIKEYIDKISFKIKLDKEYEILFNNPGVHFINDILLAIKVSLDYKIDINNIIDRISKFKMVNKRMNILKHKDYIIINDAYNSSLESISAGIKYLKNINKDKILIIGDILELGKHSKKIHKKINKLLKNLNNYRVFTVGKYSKYIKGKHFNDVDDLINYLNDIDLNNKYIYIKASRRMNFDKIIDYLKKR